MKKTHVNNANPFIFIILFAGLFIAQSYAYQMARGTWLEYCLIDQLTLKPSALLLTNILPQDNVQARGRQLVSNTTQITVLNGCEGTESIFLLIAAILAFRASWQHKLVGVLFGIVFIFLLNKVRIVSLFLALRYNRQWFHWIHAYIGPTLIIFMSCLFFLSWLYVIRKQHTTQ